MTPKAGLNGRTKAYAMREINVNSMLLIIFIIQIELLSSLSSCRQQCSASRHEKLLTIHLQLLRGALRGWPHPNRRCQCRTEEQHDSTCKESSTQSDGSLHNARCDRDNSSSEGACEI